MWRKLFKCKWSPFLTFIPKFVSRNGRLCIPHITAQWNICQHILTHHGYQLPRIVDNRILNITLHWNEGWHFWGICSDGEILWKGQKCTRVHADHSDTLVDQVREKATRHFYNFYNWSILHSQIHLQFWERPWIQKSIPAIRSAERFRHTSASISVWIWIHKCVPMELWQWCMWRKFHNPK